MLQFGGPDPGCSVTPGKKYILLGRNSHVVPGAKKYVKSWPFELFFRGIGPLFYILLGSR